MIPYSINQTCYKRYSCIIQSGQSLQKMARGKYDSVLSPRSKNTKSNCTIAEACKIIWEIIQFATNYVASSGTIQAVENCRNLERHSNRKSKIALKLLPTHKLEKEGKIYLVWSALSVCSSKGKFRYCGVLDHISKSAGDVRLCWPASDRCGLIVAGD